MNKVTKIALVNLAGILAAGAVTFGADQKPAAPAAVVPRYSEVVQAPKGAAAAQLRIEIKNWHFVRTEQGVKLPAVGFYIAQLRSGQIDTEVAGTKEHRHAGDFWTVPAGESMTVIFPAHSQSAQIQTIAIAPSTGKR